jgi:hypothetical protein
MSREIKEDPLMFLARRVESDAQETRVSPAHSCVDYYQ